MALTVSELEPGCLYSVVEAGTKPTRFLTAVVLGAEHDCPHRAVTVRMPSGIGMEHWRGVGTAWGAEDTGARFVPHNGPLLLTNPRAAVIAP